MIRLMTLAALAVAMSACVQSSSVSCGGRVCPSGTRCIELTESAGDVHRCVDEDAIAACANVDALGDCATPLVTQGSCYATTDGQVCLANGCGNGLLDRDEVCDDGNANVGDGCSAECRSNETCGNSIVDSLEIDPNNPGQFIAGEVCDDGNALGHDGCTSDCVGETAAWSDVSPGIPRPRMTTPLVYDPIRRRIVLFGGHEGGGYNNSNVDPPIIYFAPPQPRPDMWEGDGAAWIPLHPSLSPSAREGTAMAFDGPRRRTVLFGGDDGDLRDDTWEWDGTIWRLMTSSTPPPPARHGHGMAYDGRRRVAVMFGGSTDVAHTTHLGDTWEWDGTSWRQATPTVSPSGRDALGMTYDPARGVIVMVGDGGAGYETWEYDGTTWTLKATAVSLATPQVTSLAFDAKMARVLAYGYTSNEGTSTYAWDGTAWTNLFANQPGSPGSPSIVSDPEGHVMMFGGQVGKPSGPGLTIYSCRDDTWSWDGAAWTRKMTDPSFPSASKPVAPAPRELAGAALDTQHATIVVVGGYDYSTAYDETWEYDGTSWTLFDNQPWSSGRYAASIAYDAGRDEMVVFGGAEVAGTFNSETWIRKNKAWATPTLALSPPPRVNGAMSYDPVHHQVVLFGGSAGGTALFGDTWTWNGSSWTALTPAHSPSIREGAAFAWDPIAQQLVLFGGRGLDNYLSDTWTWNGVDWTEATSAAPPAIRGFGGLAWNAARGALVLFSGYNISGVLDDTWEWKDMAWSPLSPADRPSARSGVAVAPSVDGNGLFMFGGTVGDPADATVAGDTWRLRWDAALPYEDCGLSVDADADGKTGCADPDCWARCTPACPPRASCDSSAPRCGDGVCNIALESCRTCAQDCPTCSVTVCGDAICDMGETAATCPGDCTP